MKHADRPKEQSQNGNNNPLEEGNSSRKWMVLVAVGIGSLMSALDGSVVNTILPVLTKYFSSSIEQVEWIVTIYLLILSGLMLIFGRLGDLRGHKIVYLTGFYIFIISSALCGLANSVTVLISVRAFQAIGGAMISANSPAILTGSFPGSQRGQALGMQATLTYLGLTIGPSLGGFLAQQFGWQSVFYINVPIGLIAIYLSVRYIPSDRIEHTEENFDFWGAGLFMLGLIVLLYGLNQGASMGWGSAPIIGSLILSFIILFIFVVVQKRINFPMLDLRLFANSIFRSSVGSAVLNYIAVYSITFLMPFYLIQGLNYNPAQAGLILTAFPLFMAIVAPISGTFSDRIGTRIPTVIGMIILTIGLLYLSELKPDSSLIQIAIRLAVAGFGIGIFISPNTSALMGSAPHERQGIASGILATARNFGMVLGVGFSGALLTSFLGNFSSQTGAAIMEAVCASLRAASAVGALGVITTALRPDDALNLVAKRTEQLKP